jgi:hypothetical protein
MWGLGKLAPLFTMLKQKDIPNKDFDCNPKGDCWCRKKPFPQLPYSGSITFIGDAPDICYSPKELELIIKEQKK